MTREEYEKTYIRMMDSLRDRHKGHRDCQGVVCNNKCPFYTICKSSPSMKFSAYKCIEVVEQWGKEHPIVTRADKFKEVFGYEPKKHGGEYICPSFYDNGKCIHEDCEECTNALVKDFWESEYIEPSKGE